MAGSAAVSTRERGVARRWSAAAPRPRLRRDPAADAQVRRTARRLPPATTIPPEEAPMLLDLRTYTFHPGRLAEFLPAFEQEGLALQAGHCGRLVLYATTESGTLNQVVQCWAYQDAADRDARRAALWSDPAWQAFGKRALPMIQHQENRLLAPTAFSPLR